VAKKGIQKLRRQNIGLLLIGLVLAVSCYANGEKPFDQKLPNGGKVERLQTVNISSLVNDIGGLPKSARIEGVSDDGAVVIGKFRKASASNDWQIFRYTQSNGIEDLGNMGVESLHATRPFVQEFVHSIKLSSNGLIIWGSFYTNNNDIHLFRYSESGSVQDIGNFGKRSITVNGISRDGSVIVGSFIHSLTDENRLSYHAFRYSESNGFEDLGAMGAESAFARGVSSDGSVVVGNFHVADSSDHAFLYSHGGETKDIGAIGGTAAFATGVSNDGFVVAGLFYGSHNFLEGSYNSHVFLYTKAGGVQELGAMGGKSASAVTVSASGATIAGSYVDSNGESFAYIDNVLLGVSNKN
jgi:probable HAF family extracellular repeat protein